MPVCPTRPAAGLTRGVGTRPRRPGRPQTRRRPRGARGGRYLADTPAVARGSYIDPRVTDRYEQDKTIASLRGDLGASSDFGQLATKGRAERAVLRLLAR
jgi:hypothetical protein